MLTVEDGKAPSPREQSLAQARRARMEAAIKKHDRMLVRWLTSKFHDPDKASDIAQSAYVRALDYVATTDVDNPKALLFKTAANLAANEFRSLSRVRRTIHQDDADDGLSLVNAIACDAPDQERQMLARQDLQASMQAIEALPEKVRRAFILNRFEEKSYREIAEIMQVSQSSVEKYVIRALKSLRAAVKDTQYSDDDADRSTKDHATKQIKGTGGEAE